MIDSHDEEVDIGRVFCRLAEAQTRDGLCGSLMNGAWFGEGGKGGRPGEYGLVEMTVENNSPVSETYC